MRRGWAITFAAVGAAVAISGAVGHEKLYSPKQIFEREKARIERTYRGPNQETKRQDEILKTRDWLTRFEAGNEASGTWFWDPARAKRCKAETNASDLRLAKGNPAKAKQIRDARSLDPYEHCDRLHSSGTTKAMVIGGGIFSLIGIASLLGGLLSWIRRRRNEKQLEKSAQAASQPQVNEAEQIRQSLISLGRSNIDAVVAVLEGDDLIQARRAAEALGELGNEAALPALVNASREHSDEFVREYATEAIRKIRAS